MNHLKSTLRFFAVIFLIFIVLPSIAFYLVLEHDARQAARVKVFSPENNPNTKWTCLEKDLYFISDKNGQTLGVGFLGGQQFLFEASFSYLYRGTAETMTLNKIDSAQEYTNRSYYGFLSKTEDSFQWHYYPAVNSDGLFGETEDDVILTFIREDLPAPVRFTDDGYATGDGEEVVWIEPEERAG